MILFPKRENKPKKGEIADSTADKLKSAEGVKKNTDKHLLEKSKSQLREKSVKITKEMQDLKAFKKIR